jgi:hypothetical protein
MRTISSSILSYLPEHCMKNASVGNTQVPDRYRSDSKRRVSIYITPPPIPGPFPPRPRGTERFAAMGPGGLYLPSRQRSMQAVYQFFTDKSAHVYPRQGSPIHCQLGQGFGQLCGIHGSLFTPFTTPKKTSPGFSPNFHYSSQL